MSARGFCVADTTKRKVCDIYLFGCAVLQILQYLTVLLLHVLILFYIIGINDLVPRYIWCVVFKAVGSLGSPSGVLVFYLRLPRTPRRYSYPAADDSSSRHRSAREPR